MAVFSYADFTTSPSALPTQYRELINNIQRYCPTLRTLQLQNGMTGAAINFDVKVSGKTAQVGVLDGGSLPTATADSRFSVTLPFGEYTAGMKLTDKLRRVVGAIQGHEFLRGLVAQDMVETLSAMAKYMNQQIFNGSGSGGQMTGLTTPVAGSGAYGGLTKTDWIGTVSENSGTLRNVTVGMMRAHISTMAAKAGNTYGRPDVGICRGGIFDALLGLFTPTVFASQGVVSNPSLIYTNGGTVTRTGFRAFTWGSEGITFIEDPDCQKSDSTNTTSGIYFMNTSAVGLEQLPPGEQSMTDAQTMAAAQEQMGPIAGLQFEMVPRGRTTHATEWDVSCMLGLKVKCRAALGWLGDLNVAS